MLVEVEVQSLGLDRSTRSPVVILRETAGDRVLPIWIGPAEASAIAMHMAKVDFPRPLTHDLIVALVKGLDAVVRRVEIPRVHDGTYHASLVLERIDGTVEVDARPSDSIAIALRTRATIVVADDLLRDIDLDVDENENVADPGTAAGWTEEVDVSQRSDDAPLSPDELADYLRKLDPEDFGRFTP
jgi:bifunctional DNase/RNase